MDLKEARAIDRAFDEDRSLRLSKPERAEPLSLDPPAPSPGEPGYASFSAEAVINAFVSSYITIEDTLGERVMLAWRLTRELGRHTGVISSGESLAKALVPTTQGDDPWVVPAEVPVPQPGSAYAKEITSTGCPEVVLRLQQMKDRNLTVQGRHGLGLRPPDPETEANAVPTWEFAIRRLSDLLGLHQGSKENPNLAYHALPQLLSQSHEAWPARSQIVAFEELLINETVEELSDNSQRTVMATLRDRYGLLPHEQRGLTEMARLQATEFTQYDVDEARGLMILRLEKFVERSRMAMDVRAELAGLKQLAIVQGLARSEAGDLVSDFSDVVRSVSSSSSASKHLPPATQE